MLKPTVFFAAAALLMASGCSSSGSPDASTAGTAETNAAADASTVASAADSDRMICKEVKKTGTRFGTRTCLTAEQWEAIRRGGQDGVSEIQRRASHQQDMPGNGS